MNALFLLQKMFLYTIRVLPEKLFHIGATRSSNIFFPDLGRKGRIADEALNFRVLWHEKCAANTPNPVDIIIAGMTKDKNTFVVIPGKS